MSHPDPTYYHPSSCDCMGCEDRKGKAALAAVQVAAVGGAVYAAHAAAPVVAPVVAAVAPAVAVAAIPVLAVSGIKYAIANHKHKEEIKKLHADIICDFDKKIAVAIDDLNKILYGLGNRPIPPDAPAFHAVVGISIIVSIILAICGLSILLIPIGLFLAIYTYYESQPSRVKIHNKYKEDKAEFDKKFQEFIEKLMPLKKIAEDHINQFNIWYNNNGYEANTLNKKVCLKIEGPSEFSLRYSRRVKRYKVGYKIGGEPKLKNMQHKWWNPPEN
jgi:hypothetical protein